MRVKLRPQIVIRVESDDYAFLYDPDTDGTFVIDPVGVFICQHLDGVLTFKQIVRSCQDVFYDIPEDAPDQVLHFVKALINKELADTIT